MHSLLDRFETAFNLLILFLAALVALSIAFIAVSIPLNLLLVKAQWGSIWWLNEGIEYILYTGVFLGAPWVLQQGAHVRVDVLISVLPDRLAVRLEKILDVAGAALCVLLCIYGVRSALIEFEDGTLPDKDLRIDNWIVLSVFALSFALLAVEFLMRLRRAREGLSEESKTAGSGAGF